MKSFLNYWMPVVCWMVVIFFFSSRQKVAVSNADTINFLFFKTLHVLEYSFLMILALRATKKTLRTRHVLLALAICIVYAISDEIHQTFVPTREGRLRDVIIDTTGASFAWIFLQYGLPKMPKKLKDLARSLQISS
jgi:VanZ family protein